MTRKMLSIWVVFVSGLALSEAELQCEGTDASKWFLPWGTKHNDQVETPQSSSQKYQICQPFNAFGESYNIDGFRISIRGGKGAGALWVNPKGGRTLPGSFEIRASRGDYEESSLGVVSSRVSELPSDIDKAARIINEGYPCKKWGDFIPNAVFVATWTCLKYSSGRDTFQAVIAVNGRNTYLILNYYMLHTKKGGIQFSLIDRFDKNRYDLIPNVHKNDVAQQLVESTNGIRVGTWVYDLTEKIPKRPDPCPKTADHQCAMTSFGTIHTYDNAFNRVPEDVRRTLSRSLFSPHDPCNFIAHTTMDVHGKLKYIDFSAGGTYTDDDTETMINFELDREEGIVKMRGPELRKAEVLNLNSKPYYWKVNNTNIVKIMESDDGYVLQSTLCDYRLQFRPQGPEPMVRLTAGEDYEDLVEGLCGNDDGDFYNDA